MIAVVGRHVEDADRHGVPRSGRRAGVRWERPGSVLRVGRLPGRAGGVSASGDGVSASHGSLGRRRARVRCVSPQRAQAGEHPLERARGADGGARLPGQHRDRAEPGSVAAERQQRDRLPPERPLWCGAGGLGGAVGFLPTGGRFPDLGAAGHQPLDAEPRHHLAADHVLDGTGDGGTGLHLPHRHSVSTARAGHELLQLSPGASERQPLHACPLHGGRRRDRVVHPHADHHLEDGHRLPVSEG